MFWLLVCYSQWWILLLLKLSHTVESLTVRVFCVSVGGNLGGVFALGLVQGEWKLYVKRPLDREERDLYSINVTATDGLHVSTATVEVTVTDTNDNSPVCDPVSKRFRVCFFALCNTKKLFMGCRDS